MTNLIALVGQKGSGKTTLAKQLSFHYNYRQTSFATPIKLMLESILSYQKISTEDIWEMIYGDAKETPTPFLNYKSPRHAMQTLGTEWRELIDRNLWVDIWARSIDLEKEKIIIDDMRFIHEVIKIKSLNGIIVKIIRPEISNLDNHISEQEQNKIIPNFAIINNSTPENMLNELKKQIRDL